MAHYNPSLYLIVNAQWQGMPRAFANVGVLMKVPGHRDRLREKYASLGEASLDNFDILERYRQVV
jgi:hypothetical protein